MVEDRQHLSEEAPKYMTGLASSKIVRDMSITYPPCEWACCFVLRLKKDIAKKTCNYTPTTKITAICVNVVSLAGLTTSSQHSSNL